MLLNYIEVQHTLAILQPDHLAICWEVEQCFRSNPQKAYCFPTNNCKVEPILGMIEFVIGSHLRSDTLRLP